MSFSLNGSAGPSPTAYLFPGQGSQVVGMGQQMYEQSPAARAVFQQADAALNMPLTRILFSGPAEDLARTINSQPAILVTSLACLRAMEEALGPEGLPQPLAVAGHSLGEYTALVAAGALSLEDGIRLVRERGRLMQEASDRVPGGMVAILGLDEATVEEVCRQTGAHVANINAQDQVVISGDHGALARATEEATRRGARKCVPLLISGAFHSDLVRPAMEGLMRVLDGIRFRDPGVPVVANCTGRPITTAEEAKQELLLQLCSRIEWKRSVDFLVESGITNFLEVGPGRVLSGLVKRIHKQVTATSVGDMDAIRGLTSPANNQP